MLQLLYFFLILLLPYPAIAGIMPDGVRVGYGKYFSPVVDRTAEIKQYRLGLIWNIHDDLFSSGSLHLKTYAELGLSNWKSTLNPEYDPRRIGNKNVHQFSLTPVFRLTSEKSFGDSMSPFLDFGVGPSWQNTDDIEQQHLSGINTGGKWQFEIRLFVGIEIERIEISYGWMHYSNARINEFNEGVDFQTLQLGIMF